MHADGLVEASRSLAAEFPAFTFSTQRTWGGRSLVAEPRPGVRTPIRVVITSDPAEMRETLTTDQAAGAPR